MVLQTHRGTQLDHTFAGLGERMPDILDEDMTPADCKYRGAKLNMPEACGEKHPCKHPGNIFMFCENAVRLGECPGCETVNDETELEELGNRDVTPTDWQAYLLWCKYWNEAAEEQYNREEAEGQRPVQIW